MPNFNVHVSLNKKKTFLMATIRDEKNEIIKEFGEFVGPTGIKFHQKILNRTCIDWIKHDYQPITDHLQTTSEAISGCFQTTSENVSGSNI